MKPMSDRDGQIWLDGEFVPWREAKVHVLTHTLHYGMGVFEGVRAYETPHGPVAFRLADHTRRLFNSAKILAIPMPYDEETLLQAQIETVRRNHLESAYIRTSVIYGSEEMGMHAENLKVHVMIDTRTWQLYMREAAIPKGN